MSNQLLSGIGADVKMAVGVVPAAYAAGTTNGTGFDRSGFQSCVLEVSTGALTGAPSTQTVDVKLQHSDVVGSGYADFSPTVAVAQITAANTRKRKSVDLSGAKQFIRAVQVAAFTGGSSPTIGSAVTIVLGGAIERPAQADD